MIRTFLLAAILALASLSRSQTRYIVTDLGVMPGGGYSIAFGLNNSGVIAGASEGSGYQAVRWVNGSLEALGTLDGFGSSEAYDVNEAGQVVGWSRTTTGTAPFLWTSGHGMQSLGHLPGGLYGTAFGINVHGTVVGESTSSIGDYAFKWTSAAGMESLGTLPGGSGSIAYDINDNDQIVGTATTPNGIRGFFWSAVTGMVDIGLLPEANETYATALNQFGETAGDSGTRGYHWSPDSGIAEMDPSSGGGTTPYGINDAGMIVGKSNGQAFVWNSAGHIENLNNLLDQSAGLSLIEARGINEGGQIVGRGLVIGTSETHAFLATPVPEPASAVAIAGALVFLRRRNSKGSLR
jgi:probable HAF family extracellular repeat protein